MPSLLKYDHFMLVSINVFGNKHLKQGSIPDGTTVTFDMKHFPAELRTTDMNSSLF